MCRINQAKVERVWATSKNRNGRRQNHILLLLQLIIQNWPPYTPYVWCIDFTFDTMETCRQERISSTTRLTEKNSLTLDSVLDHGVSPWPIPARLYSQSRLSHLMDGPAFLCAFLPLIIAQLSIISDCRFLIGENSTWFFDGRVRGEWRLLPNSSKRIDSPPCNIFRWKSSPEVWLTEGYVEWVGFFRNETYWSRFLDCRFPDGWIVQDDGLSDHILDEQGDWAIQISHYWRNWRRNP